MKKSLLAVLAMVLFLTLTSVVYSAEEALTPEKISGIWKGYFLTIITSLGRAELSCRVLITPSLTGVVSCSGPAVGKWQDVLDGQGNIISNQLVILDRKNPDVTRLKAYITSKNLMEGDYQHLGNPDYKGNLIKFKKIRDLTDEEKQRPLSQLKGLLK